MASANTGRRYDVWFGDSNNSGLLKTTASATNTSPRTVTWNIPRYPKVIYDKVTDTLCALVANDTNYTSVIRIKNGSIVESAPIPVSGITSADIDVHPITGDIWVCMDDGYTDASAYYSPARTGINVFRVPNGTSTISDVYCLPKGKAGKICCGKDNIYVSVDDWQPASGGTYWAMVYAISTIDGAITQNHKAQGITTSGSKVSGMGFNTKDNTFWAKMTTSNSLHYIMVWSETYKFNAVLTTSQMAVTTPITFMFPASGSAYAAHSSGKIWYYTVSFPAGTVQETSNGASLGVSVDGYAMSENGLSIYFNYSNVLYTIAESTVKMGGTSPSAVVTLPDSDPRYLQTKGISPLGEIYLSHGIIGSPNAYTYKMLKITTASPSISTAFSLSQPKGIAVDQYYDVWVVYSGSGHLARFSGGVLLGATKVGNDPRVPSIDRYNSIWVTNYADNTVSKVTKSGGVVATIPVGKNPIGVCVDKNDNVWVANSGDNTVSKIVDGIVVKTIPVGNSPYGICCDLTNNIWVSNTGDMTINKITNGSVVSTISTGGVLIPKWMCVNANNVVYVATGGGIGSITNGVWAIVSSQTTAGSSIYESISITKHASLPVIIGTGISGVYAYNTYNSVNLTAVAACKGLGDMTGYQWELLFGKTGLYDSLVFTAGNSPGIIMKRDADSYKVLDTITTGYYPYDLSVDGFGNIWTANYWGNVGYSGSVTRARLNPDGTYTVSEVSTGGYPQKLCIDRDNNVWVMGAPGYVVKVTQRMKVTPIFVASGTSFTKITCARDGSTWVAGDSNIYRIQDGIVTATVTIPAAVSVMQVNRNNDLFVITNAYVCYAIRNNAILASAKAGSSVFLSSTLLDDGSVVAINSAGVIYKNSPAGGPLVATGITATQIPSSMGGIGPLRGGRLATVDGTGYIGVLDLKGTSYCDYTSYGLNAGTYVGADDITGLKWQTLFGDLKPRSLPYVV